MININYINLKLFKLISIAIGISLIFQSNCLSQKKKTVFIIIDGIPADVIETVNHPNLKAIEKEGGYCRSYVGGVRDSYSETPTISAVGYNSLLTSTWANKHNVWDNDIKEPNYNYPTIFRYLKEAFPLKKTAIFSSWLDNRTKLVGDKKPETGDFPVDYHYDGLELDTIHFPHDKAGHYMQAIDQNVAEKAAECIRKESPDLTWVYLEYTDDMGHRFGDGPVFRKAVETGDYEIGKIYDAIKYREKKYNENYLIIVTTDHGRDPHTGRNHGGQTDRERTSWIFTNAKNLNEEFRSPILNITDITPTILRFMQIAIKTKYTFELDGTPFIGPLTFNRLNEKQENEKTIKLQWKSLLSKDRIKVWISNSNLFKTGGNDHYYLFKEIKASQNSISIPVQGDFMKLLLEGTHNSEGIWWKNK